MNAVYLAAPSGRDCDEFLGAVERSREFHSHWAHPPNAREGFEQYLERLKADRHAGFFVRRQVDDALAGVVNINEIVRGCFCSGYLGYYAFVPYAGQGLMRQGLRLVIDEAFDSFGLHRLEANIQPDNAASIALARRLGFLREGFSPRYLRLEGEWRDHERWALTKENRP
ncbi:MAG: GNAT family N-acetyltransferase [Pirellulales bacterium]|nr:GNAT family N-acetyltransferase [Pirellulales bacterium]